ncbi:hypothetical protein [Chryseobacterium wanjuense]
METLQRKMILLKAEFIWPTTILSNVWRKSIRYDLQQGRTILIQTK